MIALMVLVRKEDVGHAALSRMARDDVVSLLIDGVAVAPDLRQSSAARALALQPMVPRRGAVSGLAALWVCGVTADSLAPTRIVIAVPRGSHPDAPPHTPPSRWAFYTHHEACLRAVSFSGIRVVPVAFAVTCALKRAPLALAFAATVAAVRGGSVTIAQISEAVSREKDGAGAPRLRSAWEAAQGALKAA